MAERVAACCQADCMLTRPFTCLTPLVIVIGIASDHALPVRRHFADAATSQRAAAPFGTAAVGQAAPIANPLLTHALAASDHHWISGDVETRLHAGHYTYLRLRGPGNPAWIVSLSATTPDASRVRALVIGRAEHFHSRRLQRDFSPLLFAAVRPAGSDYSDQR
jgi:hypothetical protein